MSEESVWRLHGLDGLDGLDGLRGTPLLPPLAPGPLDGLTVAVKDLFALGGFCVGAGNPAWLSQAKPEPADAWPVRALREAGAAIAGIAQTDELAFSMSGTNGHYGTPPNPAAAALVTGGSSSGPASAVAAGQADIGLGTDTAGSVRVPASACGLFGLRPTHGAVPEDGVLHLAPSFDTVGWMTADPGVLAAAGSVLLPEVPQVREPSSLLCIDVPNGQARRLAGTLGLDLGTGPVPGLDDIGGLLAAFRAVQAAQAWELRGEWITANPGALFPDVEARFRYGATVTPADRRRAEAVIAERRARVLDVLAYGAWLALPAAAGPGHRRDASPADKDAWRQATLRRTVPASAFGLPSCVLPTGARPPEGLALIGPPGADRALVRAAASLAAR